jgi:hydroxylamine dehydrogenase
MISFLLQLLLLAPALLLSAGSDAETPRRTPIGVSAETQTCIDCHETYTPGIVADWRASRHASTSPDQGLSKPEPERRVSAASVPSQLQGNIVGCYECHTLNGEKHKDNFDHFGVKINIVVSPGDCKTCHPTEAAQYDAGKKAHALENLQRNPVFHTLVETALRTRTLLSGSVTSGPVLNNTKNQTCYACHGTRIEVQGTRSIASDAGDILVPRLTNWPNHGVGRANPDGTSGSCTACHPRHNFSIEVARKPYTCGQCHLEPDVPAYNVFKESKHGNIYESMEKNWTWDAVPWTLGKDFAAPTCAACHTSMVVTPSGTMLTERSHDFGARTWVRIFGLIYSHPQPKSGKTFEIKNADGLPLPTSFTGKPAQSYLITKEDQLKRQGMMKKICSGCHGSSFIEGHFTIFDSTLVDTDAMTLAATQLLTKAWDKKMADKTNPFDESIEQLWVRQWLFYANSIRYGSAMAGPDYAAFKNGRWELTTNLQNMYELITLEKKRK